MLLKEDKHTVAAELGEGGSERHRNAECMQYTTDLNYLLKVIVNT